MAPLPLLLAVTLAQAVAPRSFAVTEGATITYRLRHPFHAVVGVSRAVEGRARWLPDGTVQVMVRARVDSFDSGNANRDAHALEVTEGARIPFVVLKAAATGLRVDAFPADVEVPLRGTLELHGVAAEVAVTARVHFASPERADAVATFPVSLTAHGVERPSLLFLRVDDRLQIEARLPLVLEPP